MYKFLALVVLVAVACAATQKTRITGGEDVNIEDHPYQLSLQTNRVHYCGATLIGDKWAITAATCTNKYDINKLTIRAGSSIHYMGGVVEKITKIYEHPNYKPKSDDYNIALITWENALNFSESIQKINLPTANEVIPIGVEGFFTGWGWDSPNQGELPDHLQGITLKIISNQKCNKTYYYEITERMLCVDDDGSKNGLCESDIGSPFVINNEVVGIALDYYYMCGWDDHIGIFTSVSRFRDFIAEISGI